ncbi:MAG: radical SAM protein [Chloroflexota bacterium]
MHIIFIHTPMPHRIVPERGRYWANFDERYYDFHPYARPLKKYLWELPHWVTWLGGVLYDQGFRSMEALDFYTDCGIVDGIDTEQIYNTLKAHPGDVYLFSPMTPNLPQALQIAEMIKELNPNSTTIFGGVVATPMHEEVVQEACVDYVVTDRGEYALPALLNALKDKTKLDNVGNLTYETAHGDIVSTGIKYPYMPVEDLPFPEVDLFPSSAGENIRYIRENYSLGCPYTCSFCTIQTIGMKPFYFPIDRVLNEIRAYRQHYGNHHHVYFGDETFTLHTQRTLDMCAALKAEGDIHYDCQTRLNRLQDPRLPKALYESGCRWLEIGLESISQDSQNLVKQRTKLAEIEDTLRRLRDEGLPTCTFMIVGLPNETVSTMRKSLDQICTWIDADLLTASYLSVFVPYPGTSYFSHPEQYGMKLHHKKYDLYHEELAPVFDSEHTTAEQAYDVFLEGVRNFADILGSKAASVAKARANYDFSRQEFGAYGERIAA